MRGDDSHPAAVKVAVRCRPSLPIRDSVRRGSQRPEGSLLVVDSESATVSIKTDAAAALPRSFAFDHVFGARASQEEVYRVAARSAVLSVTNGFNSTVFAYGQTGSGKCLPLNATRCFALTTLGSGMTCNMGVLAMVGKTHTMQGHGGGSDRGVIPRAVADIFAAIQNGCGHRTSKFLVRASFLQIYNEEISDLIKAERSGLQLREDGQHGVYVDGLSEVIA